MKKIQPIGHYDQDQQYPSTQEHEATEPADRRGFLKGLLAGGATLGTGIMLGGEAQAGRKPRPRPIRHPPGVPPRPQGNRRPRPKDTPPVPGSGRAPRPGPRPTKQPCKAIVASVTLDALYVFCHDRKGQLDVATTDPEVAKLLQRRGEGRRLAPVIKAVFAQQKSCGWLDHPAQKAAVLARLVEGITAAYQAAIGGRVDPVTVRLTLHRRPIRLGGVMVRPRPRPAPKGGCASCATGGGAEDVLVPAALVGLTLLAGKKPST